MRRRLLPPAGLGRESVHGGELALLEVLQEGGELGVDGDGEVGAWSGWGRRGREGEDQSGLRDD